MPRRLAGMIAMSWALLVPGWLAAQTFSSGREPYTPSASSHSPIRQPWSDSAPPSNAYSASEQAGVLRAAYQAPVSPDAPRDNHEAPSTQRLTPKEPAALPITPDGRQASKIPFPGKSHPKQTAHGGSGVGALVTIGSSLAIVLGLFFVFLWIIRRTMPAAAAPLPNDVVQVLGRTIVGHRQQLQLLRFGSRLLLISVTPSGAETLAEITDPDEVTHLAGLCLKTRPGSTTVAFRQVLEQLAGERTHVR